jgi:hypothetical protein
MMNASFQMEVTSQFPLAKWKYKYVYYYSNQMREREKKTWQKNITTQNIGGEYIGRERNIGNFTFIMFIIEVDGWIYVTRFISE